jgi:hypothetical protein
VLPRVKISTKLRASNDIKVASWVTTVPTAKLKSTLLVVNKKYGARRTGTVTALATPAKLKATLLVMNNKHRPRRIGTITELATLAKPTVALLMVANQCGSKRTRTA